MNQPQSTKPTSKSYLKWLLVVLGVVILATIAVYVFYVKGGNVGGVFSLSSPTPTESATIPPQDDNAQTSTSPIPSPVTSPATSPDLIALSTFEGRLDDSVPDCSPVFTFQYPSNYEIRKITSGRSGIIDLFDPELVKLSTRTNYVNSTIVNFFNSTFEIGPTSGKTYCPTKTVDGQIVPKYDSLNEVYQTFWAKYYTDSPVSTTINDYPALQWGYTTLIEGPNKSYMEIAGSAANKEVYDKVLETLRFK